MTNDQLREWLEIEAKATPGQFKFGIRGDDSAWFSIGDPVTGPHTQGDIYCDAENLTAIALACNNFHALVEELLARRSELEAWKHEREMTLAAFRYIAEGGDPLLIGHPNGSEFGNALREMLSARDKELIARREAMRVMVERLESVRSLRSPVIEQAIAAAKAVPNG